MYVYCIMRFPNEDFNFRRICKEDIEPENNVGRTGFPLSLTVSQYVSKI